MAVNEVQLNNDKRNSLFGNAVFNIAYKLLDILFPLISSGYVARILTPDGIGRHSAASNNILYFVILGSLGIQAYGTREIAKRKNDPDARSRLFSELLTTNAILTSAAVAAFAVCILTLPLFKADQHLYLLCGIAIFFNFINVDWYYQGTEEFRFIAIRSFAVKAVILAAVLIFIHKPEDIYLYALICVLANGSNHIINVIHAGKSVRFSLKGIDLISHLKPLLFLALCTVSTELYARMDITMLDIIDQKSTVAFYSYAQRIITLLVATAIAITGVFLPRLSYYFEKNKEQFTKLTKLGCDLMIFISFPVCFGIISVASPLIEVWLGDSYSQTAYILIILALMIPFKCIGDIVCYQVMMSAGRESFLMVAYAVTLAINFVNNIILIPRFGAVGASVASLISEIIVFIIVIIPAAKYQDYKPDTRNLISAVCASLIMTAVIYAEQLLISSPLLCLIIGTVSGVAIFAGLNLLFRNRFFTDNILRRVFNRSNKN